VGSSYETGLKGEFLDGRLNAAAAAFRTDQDNYAVADVGFFVPGTTDPAMRPAQGVKVEGYEVEVVGELTAQWKLSLGWTQFSARDADEVNVAVDHAREQFKLFSTYALGGVLQGLTLGGGLNWEGSRPASAVNPGTGASEHVGQGSYALVDVMAKYALREAWTVQLNATNLLDRRYRSGSYWWGSPYTWGEPRKLLLTTSIAF
jgi:outer membrane receptor for ferric coprogen and ferric-rhodotorulic acid